MLGTLLEKLGTLLPKNFIIANLFPMLLLAAANGFMLFWMSSSFRQAVENYLAMDAGKQALIGFPILIAISLAAYIFSTLNLLQREMLEGQYLPPPLKASLTERQRRRLDRLQAQVLLVRRHRRRHNRLKGVERLRAARLKGKEQRTVCAYSKGSQAATVIAGLAKKRLRHKFIAAEELERAIVLLEGELSQCPVDVRNPDAPDNDHKILLNGDQETLVMLLAYAKQWVDNKYADSFNRIEFNYSRFRLAPTSMGNIAESSRSYALTRYGMNLDPFWSRLQKVLVSDEKFYSSLVDAKTQLDFLISLFWLTVGFTAVWTVELLYLRRSIIAFVFVVVGGPLLSIIWYKIALQNYQAFADILRTSIDVFRLELLDTLHIERPKGNIHERQIWGQLNQIIGVGDPEERLPYHHPEKQT